MTAALIIAIGTAVAAILSAVLSGKNTVAIMRVLRGANDSTETLERIALDVRSIREALVSHDARITRLEIREDSRRFDAPKLVRAAE